MSSLEAVRAKIVEVVPDIRERQRWYGDGHYCMHHPDDPGHGNSCYEVPKEVSITLADVLRAIPKRALELDPSANFLYIRYFGENAIPTVAWDLVLPLDEQKPEVVEFIGKALGV